MTAVLKKSMTGHWSEPRTLTSRQGTVLTARYKSEAQAKTVESVIAKRREALLYLSKR